MWKLLRLAALSAIAVCLAPSVLAQSGVTSSSKNPMQIATLHWYPANLTTRFSVGVGPYGIAFDGANVWVANNTSNTVTKLRAKLKRYLS